MKACGKQIKINWDTSKPTGQQRRGCDTTFAKKAIGFSARVSFQIGSQKTVDWFKNELTVGRTQL